MKKTIGFLLLLTLAASAQPAPKDAMVSEVFKRLLEPTVAPANVTWPPVLEIKEEPVINAYATLVAGKEGTKPTPHVVIYRGLLDKIVQGNPDRLAFIAGHELNHVLLGHCKLHGNSKTAFVNTVFTRAQELSADQAGMQLALRAGYHYQPALGGIHKMLEIGQEYSSFEGLSADHPSWKERLALLDPKQAQLWTSLSSFENGAIFLFVEQYGSAIACYTEVTDQFPDCAEAWANLGYAQLMQYCDHLKPEELRAMKVGQIACGGFYRRSATLEAAVRGDNNQLWLDATASLERALKLDPKLTLAKANLGIAYLVDPSGPKAAKASELLRAAAKQAQTDKNLNKLAVASLLLNAGVAEVAGGKVNAGVTTMAQAEEVGRSFAGSRPGVGQLDGLNTALLYNRAQALARTDKPGALQLYREYLSKASRSSAWFSMASEEYQKLCAELKQNPKLPPAPAAASFRLLTGVVLKGGQLVSLADPIAKLPAGSTRVPVTADGLDVYAYPGVEVMATDKVMGIRLKGAEAPPLSLKESGLGSQSSALKIGMGKDEMEKLLVNQDYDFRQLDNPDLSYRFYPRLGLAVLIKQAEIQELLVMQLPGK